MTTGHNELRALALAATPGPWRVGRGSKSRIYAPYHVQPDGHAIARTYGSELNGIGVADLTGPVNIADAAYIAAANPATVLALLDEVEAAHASRREAQARVAELTEQVQKLGALVKRDERDAARYRCLRSAELCGFPGIVVYEPDTCEMHVVTGVDADAAIDAAMRAS